MQRFIRAVERLTANTIAYFTRILRLPRQRSLKGVAGNLRSADFFFSLHSWCRLLKIPAFCPQEIHFISQVFLDYNQKMKPDPGHSLYRGWMRAVHHMRAAMLCSSSRTALA